MIKKTFKSLIKNGLFNLRGEINRLMFDKQFIILTYHQINNEFIPQSHMPGSFINLKVFINQIEYLKKNYEIIPLPELLKMLNEKNIKGKFIALTFDDGDKSNELIVPILVREQLPATFFLNTAYLGNEQADFCRIFNYLYHNPLKKHLLTNEIINNYEQIFVTKDKNLYEDTVNSINSLYNNIIAEDYFYTNYNFIEKLDDSLFTIALHGHEHHRFSLMTYECQMNSLKQNQQILMDFKTFDPVFSLPFGGYYDYNFDTLRVCGEMKLKMLLNTGGIIRNHGLILPRINVGQDNLKGLISMQNII